MKDIPKKRRLSRAEAKEKTREALLEAAKTVFAQHGYYGASLDKVAEVAGYTKGAVYANFSNKEELYLALLDKHLEVDTGDFEKFIISGASSESLNDEFLSESFVEEINNERDWALLTLEFIIHAMRNDEIREKLANRIRLVIDNYKVCVEKRIASNGKELPMSPEQTAIALMTLTNGFGLLGMIETTSEMPKAYERILKLILG
ncbi:TetR/AcrR family transcriptional regulator [Herbivorax sp. ANBcel31]|uniref:TetR/AcrR family transcriptional regulator n=1 Tax=Herbivorax sp. ANBcel31 TaxID=3069754 RepID=UPI0027B14873|nr:TetR/AcrR family transcriptional regulator [Herbivorax sp. ANBcel31]MDQ2087989.1 TetR/AcrR family transcriptional regulator [Herbivorax sp. ANBcel31]